MSELEEELNRTIQELDSEIERNRRERDAIKDSKEYRMELIRMQENKFQFDPTEFVGQSFLQMIYSTNDDGARPLPSQSYNSIAIQLLHEGEQVNRVKPNTSYTCRTIVTNRGDIATPLANVELFVNKDDAIEPILKMKIVGMSTYPLCTVVTVKISKGMVVDGQFIKILVGQQYIYTKVNTVRFIRIPGKKIDPKEKIYILNLQIFGGVAQLIQKDQLIFDDPEGKFGLQESFRFEVEDVFTISGRGTVVTGRVAAGYFTIGNSLMLVRNGASIDVQQLDGRLYFKLSTVSAGMNVGLLLRGTTEKPVRGDVLINNSAGNLNGIIENINIPTKISDYDFWGTSTINVSAMSSEVLAFEFTTPSNDNRAVFAIAVRSFAILPIDMPNNFDELSPFLERHCAIRVYNWD